MNSILQSLYSDRFVISGRNALAYYGLCSFDNNVECIESDKLADLNLNLDHIIYVHKSNPEDVIMGEDGVRYASLNKSLKDALLELYDDSILEDIMDLMTEEQYTSFVDYLEKEGLQHVREQYRELVRE